jgi:SAM-dependent methyltransferase
MATSSQLSRYRRVGFLLLSLGIDPRKTVRGLRGIPRFVRTFKSFRKLAGSSSKMHLSPILGEHLEAAGSISDDYFALDLWAAKKTLSLQPSSHLDVGSRLDGFVAHILCWSRVDVLDIRNLSSTVPGLNFVQGDARSLSGIHDETYDLVTSLHAIEHFGLGRYGDPIDPMGHHRALESFFRVLKPGGHLILGFPTGRGEVLFNAQRLLNLQEVLSALPGKVLEVVRMDGSGSTQQVENWSDDVYCCVGVVIRK